ncbi:MAG: hypothetical protein WD734_05090 [Dehalococcoidia bacterium]
MLNVTPAAVEQLSEMLERTEAGDSQGIRLAENQGELGLRIDEPQEGDQVVAAGERTLLLIDPDLSSALDGATLDAVDMPEGPQLTLVGPEAAGDESPSANGSH